MPRPVVLFGAFDRHNFGDLLFAHVAAALLPGRQLVFAGLAERDLSGFGGHRVRALSTLAAGWGPYAADLVHVGGEILTCDAWRAAAMLLPPDEAGPAIAYLQPRPRQRRDWVRRTLGTAALAPYVVSRLTHPALATVVHAGVGGVDLDRARPALRREVCAQLAAADAVGVRDQRTRDLLGAEGLATRLVPDPAVMVAELFGDRIVDRAATGEVGALRRESGERYLAVQFSADFGDDATLGRIAHQLDEVAARERCGVVLFRAGAAPWHDDLATLRGVAKRMHAVSVRVFESLQLWDICALLAHAHAYCGSSLHGRIVAQAFAVPRVNLGRPGSRTGKAAAWASTWDSTMPAETGADGIADAVAAALAAASPAQHGDTRQLAARYRADFAALCAASI